MPAYHYIALSQDQKELSGIIEVPDEVTARKKLNELGLSVVSLNISDGTPSSEHAEQQKKMLFEFEAFDKNNKKVVGTITATDAIAAYARLFDEYQLNIISLVSAALDPKDKVAARDLGITSLQKEYEKRFAKKRTEQTMQDAAALAEEAGRKELIEKVDFTMERVASFLKIYGAELKTDERDAIQAYMNQLLRIRDSRNLEHIRTTCEKMLEHLQKKELFMHEEQKSHEKNQLQVETKEMLSQLKSSGLKQEISFTKIANWMQGSWLRPLSNFILHFIPAASPEVLKMRKEIKTINHQIWEYLKIVVIGKTSTLRQEAWETLKTLRMERRRLIDQLKALRITEKGKLEETKPISHVGEYVGTAAGWLLSFYLISYIAAYPFTIKNFGISYIPTSFYFYLSYFTKAITIFLFLSYIAITIHNFWLKKNFWLTYTLYPITLFCYLLIAINLM